MKMTDYTGARWAIVWRSENKLDGKSEHFLFDNGNVRLFKTRREARCAMQEKWGYIKDRADLKAEPHGWKVPTVRRVIITIKEPK